MAAYARAVTPDVLVSIRAELRRQGDVLDRVLALLERGRGPRDSADAAVVVAIKDALRDHAFRARHVMRLAETDPALREALDAADVVSSRDLGQLLYRCEGAVIHGLRIVRVKDDRRGIVWVVQVVNRTT
jgi:hypothetical protein